MNQSKKYVMRSENLKQKIVEEYLDGESTTNITKKYGITTSSLYRWTKKYENGESLKNQTGKTHTQPSQLKTWKTSYEKEMIVKEYLKNGGVNAICKKYNISSASLNSWKNKFESGEPLGSRFIQYRTLEEKEHIVEEYLDNQKTIVEICEKYSIRPATFSVWKRLYFKAHPKSNKRKTTK